mgnify:CR=1 FL=1
MSREWWRGTYRDYVAVITGPRQSVKRARKLRSEMSLPETLLWTELRKRPARQQIEHDEADHRYDQKQDEALQDPFEEEAGHWERDPS